MNIFLKGLIPCLANVCTEQLTFIKVQTAEKKVYNGNADRIMPIKRTGIPHMLPEYNSSVIYL